MSFVVLDPVQGPMIEEGADAVLLPSPRLDSLDGQCSLWNNQKMNARSPLELIRAELAKGYSFEVVRIVARP